MINLNPLTEPFCEYREDPLRQTVKAGLFVVKCFSAAVYAYSIYQTQVPAIKTFKGERVDRKTIEKMEFYNKVATLACVIGLNAACLSQTFK